MVRIDALRGAKKSMHAVDDGPEEAQGSTVQRLSQLYHRRDFSHTHCSGVMDQFHL